MCILRDALVSASLKMLCSHPSGCSDMCILRGALLHLVKTLPVFFGFVSGVRTRGVKCERNFKKNVSPLSRTWFVGVPISKVGGLCFWCVSALLVVIRSGNKLLP